MLYHKLGHITYFCSQDIINYISWKMSPRLIWIMCKNIHEFVKINQALFDTDLIILETLQQMLFMWIPGLQMYMHTH